VRCSFPANQDNPRTYQQEIPMTEDDFPFKSQTRFHREEINQLMEKIEPCIHGHPRFIILLTLLRLIAVMLGPASEKTRKTTLAAMPIVIGSLLREMDEIIKRGGPGAPSDLRH
jgi:hypothetical protein